MRLTLSLALVAVITGSAGIAVAQDSAAVGSPYVSTPRSGSGSAVYNTEPLVAGKNAPSYTSKKNQSQPYTFGDDAPQGGFGGLSPEQAQAARAFQEQQALQAQQQYLADMQKTGGMPMSQERMQAYQNGFNNMIAPEEEKPKKRRVVYNQRNNETAIGVPPRLFNPDQR